MRTIMTIGAAVLMLGSALAQQPQQFVGNGQFCLKTGTGPAQCQYQTMVQCEQAEPTGSKGQCVERRNMDGTVGVAPRDNPTPEVPSPSNPVPE
jgi:hypothetical protein